MRTERLAIRPATAEDADAMFDIRSRPEVGDWLPILPTDREAWRERFAEPDRLAMTLAFELDGEIIGDLYLRVTDAWAQAEVEDQAKGDPRPRSAGSSPRSTPGRGYATEARRRAAADLLRGPRPAPGGRAVLRRQRGVLADHGEGSACAARSTPCATRCTAPAAGSTA